MRQSLFKAESNLLLAQSQKHHIEEEYTAARRFYNINPEISTGFIEDFVADPEQPNVNMETMNEANSVLTKPLDFYGCYLSLAQFKKTEIYQSATIKKLCRVIAQMKVEAAAMVE